MNEGEIKSGTIIGHAGLGAAIGGFADATMGKCMAQQRQQLDATVRVTVELKAIRSFADALMYAKDGQCVTRAGWNAAGQHVEAQYPDHNSKMGAPYLVLKNAQGLLVPWVPSQGDLFANDWAVLPR
ncbi:DUF2829 domain-containing protein [Rhizobacter sp. OV335]|uniref:DUF2829 domain-containing protein n=1 Tax=Rhizobacter sp. OV335 TaxID=1500264 RepID=UPI000915E302|nr:DUF2829 domain-containing protein [Rhizobacter sp. OV335]SHN40282.1 Protein of unknown function [Rhizobacter sp. OV335]